MAELRASTRFEIVGGVALPFSDQIRADCDAALAIPAMAEVVLDFSRVGRVSSNGVAALLHVASTAQRHGVALRFHAAPADLQSMLRLTGLDDPDLFR